MKVLGMDTSSYANSIGISDGAEVLLDRTFPTGMDSLVKIISNIDSVLCDVGLTLGDIEGFGVGLGPGSWTGIRIGVTVGKMLAFSTGKPVCGVPSLQALAAGIKENGLVCSIVNAGAGDAVYAGFYRADGSPSLIGAYYTGGLAGLAEGMKEPVTLTGPQAQHYAGRLKSILLNGDLIKGTVDSAPRGGQVARLAAARLGRGESDNVLSLSPLYLKESTARVFQGREGGREC